MDEWTPDLLKVHYDAMFEERRDHYDAIFQERRLYYDTLFAERLRALEAGDKALSEHIVSQIAQIRDALVASDKMVNIALTSSEKAINKAETATEKRFESVNEFRAQLTDQTNTFLPRETFDQFVKGFEEYKDSTSKALTLREGREGGSAKTIAFIFAGLAGVSTIIGIIVVLANVLTK